MKGRKNDRSKDITNELIKKASRLLKGEKLNKEQSEAYTPYTLEDFIDIND
jgi:hypothetical protein